MMRVWIPIASHLSEEGFEHWLVENIWRTL
ncbi:hypothetical protein EMIT0324P_20034 [Pseudomonas chlororaphis]